MNTARADIRSIEPEQPASLRAEVSRVRDALASSSQRMDREYPEALDLLARALVAIGEPLRGAAGVLSGTHSDDAWREQLRGERVMPAYDLFRLVESDHPRAARAVDRLLAVLLDRRAARRQGLAPLTLAEAAARLSKDSARLSGETSDVLAAALRALADGRATMLELDVIERELDEQETAASAQAASAATMRRAVSIARGRA